MHRRHLVRVVIAFTAIMLPFTARAQICPGFGGTPTASPCEFLGFDNVPKNASLILDSSGNLVVCSLVGADVPFIVSWQVPSRTGHTDWIDLGMAIWEALKPPGELNDALVEVTSSATLDGNSDELFTARMADNGNEVEITTDFGALGVTTVQYEICNGPTNCPTVLAGQAMTSAVLAAEFPTGTEFSVFYFENSDGDPISVTMTLPGGATASGSELHVRPESNCSVTTGMVCLNDGECLGGERCVFPNLDSVEKVSQAAENTRQAARGSESARGLDVCPGDQFTMIDEGLGIGNGGVIPGAAPIPAMPSPAMIVFVLAMAATAAYFVYRR